MNTALWITTVLMTSVIGAGQAGVRQTCADGPTQLRQMDTNLDNKVSKAEFLAYQSHYFEHLPLVDGMLPLPAKWHRSAKLKATAIATAPANVPKQPFANMQP